MINDLVAKLNGVGESSSAVPNASRPEQRASRALCDEMRAQALSSEPGERGERASGLGTDPPTMLSRANSRGSRGSGLVVKMKI